MKEKGIEDAVAAVEKVNDELGFEVFLLDIYGQVQDAYKDHFEHVMSAFPECVRYCGTVDADKSVDVLNRYFALLFPTFYEGEGFAGTLIDAYSAGLPVIASDWKYNRELVSRNVGYVYPTGNQVEFEKTLKDVALNPNLILEKKNACIEESCKYSAKNVVALIIKNMEGCGSEYISI